MEKQIKKICNVDGCDDTVRTKGFCNKHYQKFLTYGDPLYVHHKYTKKICIIDNCNNITHAKGLCDKHYYRLEKHGDPLFVENERHRLAESSEYNIWGKMKSRCYNPKSNRYHSYGGRGITVCDRWKNSFIAFYEDMGKRPTLNHQIDRIDNDGNYEPGNCRWVTRTNNMRHTSRTRLTIEKAREIRKDSLNMTNKQLVKKYNISKSHISAIIHNRLWKDKP